MILVGLVPEVVQTEDGVVILLLPLLGIVVEGLGILLLLSESIELRTEDLLSVPFGSEVVSVLSVDVVVLLKRSLKVLSDGGSDEGGSSGEDGVSVGS